MSDMNTHMLMQIGLGLIIMISLSCRGENIGEHTPEAEQTTISETEEASGAIPANTDRFLEIEENTDDGPLPGAIAQYTDLVESNSGMIQGEREGGLRIFRGIPFAEPPIGNNRLRAPTPKAHWDGVLNADVFGSNCIQQRVPGITKETDEDCLYLNVFSPAVSSDDGLKPIMIWLYGGAFLLGGANWDVYEPSQLAFSQDVVVANLNYRIGALGFMALPELKSESEVGTTGNYGLLDQLMAIRWIKENAKAFGGDPDNITVFGESAGAISLCALMASPLAEGLFTKAILQSGNCDLFPMLDGDDDNINRNVIPTPYDLGESYARKIGCDGADIVSCLRQLPADDFRVSATQAFIGDFQDLDLFWPAVDGYVLDVHPRSEVGKARLYEYDMILGSNADEGIVFTATDWITTNGRLRDVFEKYYDDEDLIDALMDIYGFPNFGLPKFGWENFFADFMFNCPIYLAAHEGPNRFYYYMTEGPRRTSSWRGPTHGADLFYVFQNFYEPFIGGSEEDYARSGVIQDLWASFARRGRPESNDVIWPQMPINEEWLEFGDTVEIKRAFREGRCEQLQALGILK